MKNRVQLKEMIAHTFKLILFLHGGQPYELLFRINRKKKTIVVFNLYHGADSFLTAYPIDSIKRSIEWDIERYKLEVPREEILLDLRTFYDKVIKRS